MTETELEKKWENTVWDTDVYLDDLDGKEPMTNEEHLKSLNTEQLAEFLKGATDSCATCSENDYDLVGKCPFGRCRTGLNEFVEWLKEKHNAES